MTERAQGRRCEAHYEIEARVYSVRIYDGHHPDNYSASMQVFIQGRVGHIYSVIGPGFWQFMARHGRAMFADLGIDVLEGEMIHSHARLARRMLRGLATVESSPGGCPEREMELVRVRIL